MKTIKIKFSDMPKEYNIKENYITKALGVYFNIEFSDTPDFLFYSNFGTNFYKYKNCVKIFITGEPVLPNYNDCDYSIDYSYINFGDRHFHAGGILGNMGYNITKDVQNRSFITDDFAKRKFCNFVYSNDKNGNGAMLRKEFCICLSKYKKVDCPGRVLNNQNNDALIEKRYINNLVLDENWVFSKLNYLSQYKFTIAFENADMSGFTTEKMYHAIKANTIPIYWGDPDVVKKINPKAFISCADYNNNFELITKKIIELDNDDEKYLSMLREKPLQDNYNFDEEKLLADYLKYIIDKGNKPYNKNPLGFIDVTNMPIEEHCRLGNIGMRTILKSFQSWLIYKIKKGE